MMEFFHRVVKKYYGKRRLSIKMEFFHRVVKNTMGKGENAGHQCYQKRSTAVLLKFWAVLKDLEELW